MESQVIENAVRGVDHRERNGMDLLVVPVAALRSERVRSGYVPTDEIEKAQTAWNGTPITIAGPTDTAGEPISMNTPRIVDRYHIGTLFNTSVDGDTLTGEAWIHPDVANERSDEFRELVDRLERGDQVSVSSSFYANRFDAGEYDGEIRSSVVGTLNPDHIALLPEDSGTMTANSERTDPFPSNVFGERRTQLDNQE
jgi:hypothetical protein